MRQTLNSRCDLGHMQSLYKESKMIMAKEQASLYRRWNPTKLDEVCGNVIAVAKCRTLIENTESR